MMRAGLLQSKRYPLVDSEEAIEFYFQRGWTDGLPIVPPTPARVERMLQGTQRDPAELIGLIPPNYGKATVEKIAINAAMAGCLPSYLPVVITAVQAITDSQFNLHGVQATTGPHSPLCIVNGPIRQTLEINGGPNVFGSGWRANSTIGRAVKLIMLNLGGAKPGEIDKSTLGHPGKYTFCIAENEEESPWEPFHVEHGFAREVSTVAVVAAESPLAVSDTTSRSARDLVTTMGASLAVAWNARMYLRGQSLLVIGPEHAQTIASDGWTKADIKRFLYENVRKPLGELLSGPEWELGMSRQTLPAWLDTHNDHSLVPKFINPDEILIVVAGGTAGTHSACLSSWGSGFTSRMVIKPIEA
jgi:hypothetical protein